MNHKIIMFLECDYTQRFLFIETRYDTDTENYLTILRYNPQ